MTTAHAKARPLKVFARDFMLRVGVPLVGACVMITCWGLYVELSGVPPYILPGPGTVATALTKDWYILLVALWATAQTTFVALLLAIVGGGCAAVVLVQSRWLETLLSPVMVTLQVTPIVAIAPLILIYAPTPWIAQLICAFLVTFFPIMLNTLQGLKSADRHHADLLKTYSASRWQTLIYLKLPSALPSFFTGLKMGGGLALVAAVVGEFAAGQAGNNAGLAFRLLEAQYRLNMPRLFACLILLAILGAVIFGFTSKLSELALRHWHESEQK
ncbi:ABC transporter permease [Agrobacterium leguminum]|uniref:ABC transporter permease n=1 Tax=Agrobacterium leguminum TaxID=2792015 RepID=A0A9X3KID8_9HYPH|nr:MULTISPECIES: ABC transporter permease [Agrobacterium]MCZ7912298.1 ABC transporter permease [Agrobacterium leguminum]